MHVVSRLPQMSSLVHSIALYTIAINTVASFKVMTTSNHTHTHKQRVLKRLTGWSISNRIPSSPFLSPITSAPTPKPEGIFPLPQPDRLHTAQGGIMGQTEDSNQVEEVESRERIAQTGR